MAFLPILVALLVPAFAFSAEWGTYMKNVVGNGPGFVLLFLTAIGAYLYLALRRRYDRPAWSALLKSVLLSAGVILIMQLYSGFLFFAVFYATM